MASLTIFDKVHSNILCLSEWTLNVTTMNLFFRWILSTILVVLQSSVIYIFIIYIMFVFLDFHFVSLSVYRGCWRMYVVPVISQHTTSDGIALLTTAVLPLLLVS